jgi:hypothetical protein
MAKKEKFLRKDKTAEELVEHDFPAEEGETPLTDFLPKKEPEILDVTPLSNREKVDVLSQFTGNREPQVTIDDIISEPDYSAAIPAQDFFTYFPSQRNQIQKGVYAGQITGSNPIYAPSQLMPYGLIDARQNALKQAAEKEAMKQAALQDRFKQLTAPPKTKHKAVQQNIQNSFYDFLENAQTEGKRKYGANYHERLMQDPEFLRGLNMYTNMAEMESQAVDQVAKIEHGINSGKFAETPFTRRMIKDFYSGQTGMLSSMDPEEQQRAFQALNLAPVVDLMTTASDIALQTDVFEGLPDISPEEKWDMLTSTKTESVPQKRIKTIADNQWKAKYEGKEDLLNFTKKDLQDAIAAQYGLKITRDVKTVSTGDGGSGAKAFKFSQDAVEKEPKTIRTTYQGQDPSKTRVVEIETRDGYTFPKATAAKIAPGTSWFDVGDSQGGNIPLKKTSGVKDVSISEVRNVPVYDEPGSEANGRIMSQEELANAKKKGYGIKYRTMVVASLQGDEASDEFIQKTVMIPIEEVKGAVEVRDKSGKFVKGVDTEWYENKAKEASVPSNLKKDKASKVQSVNSKPEFSLREYNNFHKLNATMEEVKEAFGDKYIYTQ